ncbi:hypothetical protein ACHAWO_012336 [Cyclotella atomus]|uniref:Uncharacterized protein n=1 Tax=Cyclotella atomus TaxID=382360 RepID=A0ABD3N689_9STRA
MVYINSDGTVGGPRKRRSPLRFVYDLISGLFDFVGLFFRTLTASPAALEAERGQRRTTYSERQGVRRANNGGGGGGANVRGVKNLGCAKAGMGG